MESSKKKMGFGEATALVLLVLAFIADGWGAAITLAIIFAALRISRAIESRNG